MPTAPINGIDLYYDTCGSGPPLLLIAGLGSDSQSWLPVIDSLARRFTVIASDNRGMGRTQPTDVETSIESIAADCIQLVEWLGIESVDVAGHSMGGFVAQVCVVQRPGRVRRMVLAATGLSNSARNNLLFTDWAALLATGTARDLWFRNLFYWIFSRHFFQNPAAVEAAVKMAVEYTYPPGKTAFARQVTAIADFDGHFLAPMIHAKTLVLAGKENLLFEVDACTALARAITDAQIVVLDRVAHSIHMEDPRTFTDCIVQFLSR
jgi:pimeloyl-ACP methyl ester carboxylesterase